MEMAADIVRIRLSNQGLSAPRFNAAERAAAWMGAVQSQDYAGAKWALGLRLTDAGEADVDAALESLALVRSWVPRGTLHFAAAADLRWMTALLAPRLIAGNSRRYGELELDETTLERSRMIMVDALNARGALKRSELLAAVRNGGISTVGQRAPYLMQDAALHGLVCQSVTRGGDAVYHLVDRLAPAPPVDGDAALAELARRYFQSRGPATLEDFIWWSGMRAGDARAAVDFARPMLIEERLAGRPAWRGDAPYSEPPQPPAAWLLPAFDEYLVAYRDRAAVLDPRHAQRLARGGILSPAIALDGRIAGVWTRVLKKDKVKIHLDLFDLLDDAELAAVRAAADRYADFIGKTAVASFTSAA